MLLGLDAMQLTSLRMTKAAYYASVASGQISNMNEQLRALAGQDKTSQLIIWNQQNAEVLPQGRGTVEGRYPHYIISVYWGKNKKTVCIKPEIGQSGCLSEPFY